MVNTNAVSLGYTDFSFMLTPIEPKRDRWIGIVFNVFEFTTKCIFSTNQVRVPGHLYYKNSFKLGSKHRLVNTDGREIRIVISDVLV